MTEHTSTELSDRHDIEGDLGLYLCEELWNKCGPIHLASGTFRCAYDEEFTELGYPEDDNTVLLLRRESDGAFFEIDVELYARHVQPKAPPQDQQIDGQATLFDDTATEGTPT